MVVGNENERTKVRNAKQRQFQDKSEKVKFCRRVLLGTACTGDCKFEHDTQKYLEKKPKDIAEVCPVFLKYGFAKILVTSFSFSNIKSFLFSSNRFCEFGVTCRFASSHLNEKGENQTNQELVVIIFFFITFKEQPQQRSLCEGKAQKPQGAEERAEYRGQETVE